MKPAVRLSFALALILLAGLVSAPPARALIRIAQFGITCASGASNSSFVQLSSTLDDFYDPRIGLQFVGADGGTRADIRPIFGNYNGAPWIRSLYFLVGDTDFTSANQNLAGGDVTLPLDPDPVRGRVVLYRLNADNVTRTTMQTIAYGGPGEPIAPPPGAVIRNGQIVPDADLAGYWGTFPDQPCYHLSRWKVSELSLACATGSTTSQFLELTASGPGTLDGSYHVLFFDHTGAQVADLANPWGALAGQTYATANTFLLASPGLGGDAALPVTLDPAGGHVDVTQSFAGSPLLLDRFTWGGANPLPTPGASIGFDPESGGVVRQYATPWTFASGGLNTHGCWYPGPYYPPFNFGEIATACGNGDAAGGFVELGFSPGLATDPRVHLRVLDHSGSVLSDLQIFSTLDEPVASTPGYMLFGAPGFAGVTGVAPNRSLPATLDPVAGEVAIVAIDALTGQPVTLSQVDYGSVAIPAPAPGNSLQNLMTPTGPQWVTTLAPTPTRLDGTLARGPSCYSTPSTGDVKLSEVMLRCRNQAGTSFVELVSSNPTLFAAEYGLRAYDHTGTLRFDLHPMFGTRTGQYWPPNTSFLLASIGAVSWIYGSNDALLPGPLDPESGRLQLTFTPAGGATQVVDELAYGTTPLLTPAPGQSLARLAPPAWSLLDLPTPTNSVGGTFFSGNSCIGRCPTSYTPLAGLDAYAVASERDVMEAGNRVRIDMLVPSMLVKTAGRNGTYAAMADEYVLEGLPPGTVVGISARWHTHAELSGQSLPPAYRAHASVQFQEITLDGLTQIDGLLPNGDATILRPIRVAAGEPFTISAMLAVSGSFWPGLPDSSGQSELHLDFLDIPQGAQVTSCYGYESGVPVATELSLVDASAEPHVAHLRWFAAGDRPTVTLERREGAGEWAARTALTSDGQGFYAFDDADVRPGSRYTWRLAWNEGGVARTSPEVTLDIPSGVSFALRGVRPNPTAGSSTIAFALDRTGDVRTEVLDIAGRRVMERTWPALTAGEHTLPFAKGGDLAPGVYLVRLSHGGRTASTRVIVTR